MGTKMADQGTEGLFSPFLRSLRLKAACPYIKGRVLDVGCGTGAWAVIVFADLYVMVDVDRQTLSLMRKQHPHYTVRSSLPPAEPVFDKAIALVVFRRKGDLV